MQIHTKRVSKYRLQTGKAWKKGGEMNVCRCMIPQAVIFRFPAWKRGTPNICSTEGCQLPETLINHTHAITITANSLPLVITALTKMQPVRFDWFNSSHSLIYGSSGPTLSLRQLPSPHMSPAPLLLPLFDVPLMPLKVGRAESVDILRVYKVCALSWEVKMWQMNGKIPAGTEKEQRWREVYFLQFWS